MLEMLENSAEQKPFGSAQGQFVKVTRTITTAHCVFFAMCDVQQLPSKRRPKNVAAAIRALYKNKTKQMQEVARGQCNVCCLLGAAAQRPSSRSSRAVSGAA